MSAAIVECRDRAMWDDLLSAHRRGHLLQSWSWGTLKSEFGWQPMRLAVVDASGVRAAAQMLLRRVLGLAVCYVPRGPMYSGDAALDGLLLAALRRTARRHRAVFLRLEPNVLEDDPDVPALNSALQVAGFRVAEPLQPRSSIHLDLVPPPDRLLAGFSKGHRADVRRAERSGVTVRVGHTVADLEAFYRIMQATAARAEFAIHSLDYYRRAWEVADEHARLLLASHIEHGDVAAFMVFAGWGESQYMYSGATAEGLKSGASHLLQWHAIQWAREQGARHYDLWGVPDVASRIATADEAERAALQAELEADPLHGVFRFKKGWGGRIVRYMPAYDQVYFAPGYWLWRRHGAGG